MTREGIEDVLYLQFQLKFITLAIKGKTEESVFGLLKQLLTLHKIKIHICGDDQIDDLVIIRHFIYLPLSTTIFIFFASHLRIVQWILTFSSSHSFRIRGYRSLSRSIYIFRCVCNHRRHRWNYGKDVLCGRDRI